VWQKLLSSKVNNALKYNAATSASVLKKKNLSSFLSSDLRSADFLLEKTEMDFDQAGEKGQLLGDRKTLWPNIWNLIMLCC